MSHAAGEDVAIDLPLNADEDDAVPRGVSLVPFHLVIGDRDFRPVRNLSLAGRDDRNIVAAIDLEDVGLVETFNFAAPTDAPWMWTLAYWVSQGPHAKARLQADAMAAFAKSAAKINPTPQGLRRRQKAARVSACALPATRIAWDRSVSLRMLF
jgi:hypothetical protein